MYSLTRRVRIRSTTSTSISDRFPSGVFWTNFIASHSVHAEDDDNFEDGARLNVEGLALFDYLSINNALSDGNSIDAKVSYDIR